MADSSDKRSVRVLVVEDDVELLSGLRDLLNLEGYTVTTATNGVEGLEVLAAYADLPDLIVANVLMPRMDGLTFIREIRRRPQYQHIPFIIESAGHSYKTEAIESGAAQFLMSPFGADEFVHTVAAALAAK